MGDLQFAKRDPSILLAWIVGPMMSIGLAMVVIVIMYWMKRTRRGPWRKRVLSEPHVRYHAGEIVQIGTEQDGTAIYRMNNNHNQNRELTQLKSCPLADLRGCATTILDPPLLVLK